jgi:PST family polysaccharide transporter
LSDLSTNLKKGFAINFIGKYSNICIQIIITSILARLLTPKDYGIVSVILIFITFFGLLGDMGIGPAIIQYKDLDDNDISSIFIFTFFIAIVLSLLFFGFSYLIAYMYYNNIYIMIGHLLCFSVIFNVLCIVPNCLQLKNKQFKIVAISNLVSNLIAGIITIILAYRGFSYYALVINSIVQAMLNFVILFHFSKIKLNFKSYSLEPIKKISSFSIYQFLFNFINYFSRNSDNLLIGKFLGMNPLGYYDKAYKLMLYPIQSLTFVINPVLQPVLSDYQDRKDIILMHYKKIVKISALMGAFISVFCFFSAKEIILIMFGGQWIGSVTSFKLLSISIIFQMVLSSIGTIFQATNTTKYLFINGLISAVTMILLIIIGLIFGKIEYVALLLVLGFLINFLQGYYILITKVFKKSFLDFLKEFKSTVIIVVIMIVFYLIFKFNIKNNIINFTLKCIIGIVSYIFGLFITKEYMFIKNIVFNKK